MSVKDSYTDFHVDFGGTSVWYHLIKVRYYMLTIFINFMVRLEFKENIKMLAVPTNDISDQKYFVHLIRTSLSKSGTNFLPIGSVQYFGEKTNHEL